MEFPEFALYDDADEHDPDGVVFIRRVLSPADDDTPERPLTVSWFKAGALSLNPLELYVRMYSVGGGVRTPTHYVRLDLVRSWIEYQRYCRFHGLDNKPTLEYYVEIIKAVDEFEDMRTTELPV